MNVSIIIPLITISSFLTYKFISPGSKNTMERHLKAVFVFCLTNVSEMGTFHYFLLVFENLIKAGLLFWEHRVYDSCSIVEEVYYFHEMMLVFRFMVNYPKNC